MALHMRRHERSAPIWLFSFVDLAFLLLIAFTQIGSEASIGALAVGEIEIPRIETGAPTLDGSRTAGAWQLRVHPVLSETEAGAPFELVSPEPGSEAAGVRIDAADLAARLELLRSRSVPKPILAPHRSSRSEDLLVAVGLLEDAWRGRRFVTVRPAPPVAADAPLAAEPARR